MPAAGLVPKGASVVADPGMQLSIVRIVNDGATDFNMEFSPTERLVIPVGGETFVTEEVAWYFLGRWWANNANPRYRERAEDYRRLRTLYGAYEDDAAWEQRRPRLTAYTPDGQRITTVVDDPEGTQSGQPQMPKSREQALESQLDFMGSQMAQMQAQLDKLRDAEPNVSAPAHVPEEPRVAPSVPTDMAPRAANTPPPKTANLPNVGQVPVAPPEITESLVDTSGVEHAAPPRLPVHAEVIEITGDEGESIPVDGPTQPKVGPARVGG